MTNEETMTNDFAKIVLVQLNTDEQLNVREHEAIRVAIKALEQQTCEDAVSRQAVLKIQAKYAKHMGATKFWQMRDDVKALPPVTPQYTDVEIQKMQDLEQAEIQKAYELGKAEEPKIGHWKEYNKPYDIDGTYYCYCDNCGYIAHEKMDFCPDCKAKMIEPQESEVNE